MRTFLLAVVLLCSSALAQTMSEVQKWPVLYQPIRSRELVRPTLTPQEAALLQQIAGDANRRPELRKYRASLPTWAQKNLRLDDLMFMHTAPYRSRGAERLTVFAFAENWDARLVVLSGSSQSSAWVLAGGGGCAPWEEFVPYDVDGDGQMELGWAHGCADSDGMFQTFSLLDWQGGVLRLTHETQVNRSEKIGVRVPQDKDLQPGGMQEITILHVNKGPKPQLVGLSTYTETYFTDNALVPLPDSTRITLRRLASPVQDPSFQMTRLW